MALYHSSSMLIVLWLLLRLMLLCVALSIDAYYDAIVLSYQVHCDRGWLLLCIPRTKPNKIGSKKISQKKMSQIKSYLRRTVLTSLPLYSFIFVLALLFNIAHEAASIVLSLTDFVVTALIFLNDFESVSCESIRTTKIFLAAV